MKTVLNVLGAALVLLVLVLAKRIETLVGLSSEARRAAAGTRLLIRVFGVTAFAFAAVGVWSLVSAGYWPVAGLVVTVLVIWGNGARKRAARARHARGR